MADEWMDRWQAIQLELANLDSSPPAVLHRAQRKLRSMLYSLERNTAELLAFLDESSELDRIWERAARGGRPTEEEVFETSRLLLNFVTAARAVEEHARRHLDTFYAGSQLAADYQSRIDADLKAWDVNSVVRGFRNYLQHRELPLAGSKTTITMWPGTVSHDFVIFASELLLWRKWPKPARDMLNGLAARGEPLALRDLVVTYGEGITRFYDALIAAEEEVSREPYDRFLTARRVLVEEAAALVPPPTITITPIHEGSGD